MCSYRQICLSLHGTLYHRRRLFAAESEFVPYEVGLCRERRIYTVESDYLLWKGNISYMLEGGYVQQLYVL